MFEVIILKGKTNHIYNEKYKISDHLRHQQSNLSMLIARSDHDVHIKADMIALATTGNASLGWKRVHFQPSPFRPPACFCVTGSNCRTTYSFYPVDTSMEIGFHPVCNHGLKTDN